MQCLAVKHSLFMGKRDLSHSQHVMSNDMELMNNKNVLYNLYIFRISVYVKFETRAFESSAAYKLD